MICFRCGEKNPDSYSFCGMCGSPLQRTAEGTRATQESSQKRSENFTFTRAEKLSKTAVEPPPQAAPPVATPVKPLTVEDARPVPREVRSSVPTPTQVARETVPQESARPISGPSLLGLDDPGLDVLRERAFSSADETYFEPAHRSPAWGRIFGTLLLIGLIGGVIWWRHTGYKLPSAMVPAESTTAQTAGTNEPVNNTPASNTPAASTPAANAPAATTSVPSSNPQSVSPPNADTGVDSGAKAATVPQEPVSSGKAVANTSKNPATADTADDNSEATEQPPTATTKVPTKPAKGAAEKATKALVARNEPPTPVKATKPATPAPSEGDALFKKGEAFLYGRGVPESCDQAMKYLKAASDKSHAKARSTFGTMYATGHCVGRDLPSSYRWFALALRVDPNNQILEKDLSAVWNQMTPPERQLATKSQ